MTSIIELTAKLLPIIAVTARTSEKIPQLYTLRDIVQSLQYTFYWFQSAERELAIAQSEDEIITTDSEEEVFTLKKVIPPTLIGAQENMDYLKEQLSALADATDQFINSSGLPIGVEYKMRQGYNKIMEGLFSVQISNTYYDEFNRRAK